MEYDDDYWKKEIKEEIYSSLVGSITEYLDQRIAWSQAYQELLLEEIREITLAARIAANALTKKKKRWWFS